MINYSVTEREKLMATTELRCKGQGEGDLYGIYDSESHTIEVRCKRRRHGAKPGIIVLHTISLANGQVIKTAEFKDPARVVRKENDVTR
jgi:hypothetical protein